GETEVDRPAAVMQGEQKPSPALIQSTGGLDEPAGQRRQRPAVVDPATLRIEGEGDGKVRRPVETESKGWPRPDARLTGQDVTDALGRRPTKGGRRIAKKATG